MPKSWAQKMSSGKPPHVVTLDKAFAGVPAGARLFIASPHMLDERIRRIPPGEFVEPADLRAELAAEQGADATCPVSTSIFLRIVSEAAIERIAGGEPPSEVTPFWRVVAPDTPLARKLTCDGDFIATMRTQELHSVEA